MNEFTLINAPQERKVQLLEEFNWIENLNGQQRDKLAGFLKAYSIQPGKRILTEGSSNDFFCMLCVGQVAVVKEDAAGKAKELQLISPGKLFGEMSFFDRGPCSASIVAKEEATVLIMEKDSFSTLALEVPQIALQITLHIIEGISLRLRQTTGKLIDLM